MVVRQRQLQCSCGRHVATADEAALCRHATPYDYYEDVRRDAKCTEQHARELREDALRARKRSDRLWSQSQAAFKRAAELRHEAKEIRERRGW